MSDVTQHVSPPPFFGLPSPLLPATVATTAIGYRHLSRPISLPYWPTGRASVAAAGCGLLLFATGRRELGARSGRRDDGGGRIRHRDDEGGWIRHYDNGLGRICRCNDVGDQIRRRDDDATATGSREGRKRWIGPPEGRGDPTLAPLPSFLSLIWP
uniref:Uncharacterized protein n=1 Tax=Oryza rufipogon TaxID=4529 RepID=A0A0E0MRU8_ORYRU